MKSQESELCLSENTVKTHFRSILRKLGAKNRGSAVTTGIERGLLPRPN